MKYKSSSKGEIEIKDMHPKHLENAIKKLEKNDPQVKLYNELVGELIIKSGVDQNKIDKIVDKVMKSDKSKPEDISTLTKTKYFIL